MLAYVFWHRPYLTTTAKQYEEALLRFQQHLRQQDPPGFRGSASFRVPTLPWLGNRPGYEDWCLLEGSWALDPLNSFAVAGPRDECARCRRGPDGRGVWRTLRFGLGRTRFAGAVAAIWLTRPRGIEWRLVLDTVHRQFPQTTLWRRQMVLGPGKEFGLIAPPGVGVAPPSGWSALSVDRARVVAPL